MVQAWRPEHGSLLASPGRTRQLCNSLHSSSIFPFPFLSFFLLNPEPRSTSNSQEGEEEEERKGGKRMTSWFSRTPISLYDVIPASQDFHHHVVTFKVGELFGVLLLGLLEFTWRPCGFCGGRPRGFLSFLLSVSFLSPSFSPCYS